MLSYKEYILRKPVGEDAEGFYRISHDEAVNRYYGAEGTDFADIGEARGEVAWCLSQFAQNAGRWIIAKKTDNAYIGDIGFFNYVAAHRRAELGYRLESEYWGRGIVTHFIGQLIAWGFEALTYNRIEALADVRNAASRKVLIKNGFTMEGTLRQYEYEHGGYVDLAMYSILRDDFFRKDCPGR